MSGNAFMILFQRPAYAAVCNCDWLRDTRWQFRTDAVLYVLDRPEDAESNDNDATPTKTD